MKSVVPVSLEVTANMLALNALHEIETSTLDETALQSMLDSAFYWAAPADGRDGMLIAFDQDAAYEGFNFHWFRSRYSRFVYIDRVIVASHRRGQGMARELYTDLICAMRRQGQSLLTCEINVIPPNPASMAMHAALGFEELARAMTPNGKTVSYQALRLS